MQKNWGAWHKGPRPSRAPLRCRVCRGGCYATVTDVERLYERYEGNIRCVRSTAAAAELPPGAAAVRCESEISTALRELPRSSLVTCVKQHGCDISALLTIGRRFEPPRRMPPLLAPAASNDRRHTYATVYSVYAVWKKYMYRVQATGNFVASRPTNQLRIACQENGMQLQHPRVYSLTLNSSVAAIAVWNFKTAFIRCVSFDLDIWLLYLQSLSLGEFNILDRHLSCWPLVSTFAGYKHHIDLVTLTFNLKPFDFTSAP